MKKDININSMKDLQDLVVSGYEDWAKHGYVTVRPYKNLLLFNYQAEAQFRGNWTFFERVSRGLLINQTTGEIVARSFDKFFNWFEGGRVATGHIVSITEKIDGSTGILFRDDDGYRISTRGRVDSEQGIWATKFLRENYDLTGLNDDLTLIFEIIYPENRIVVNYGDREDLVLLAARNRHTGEYLSFFPDVYELATEYGFNLPKVYTFNDVTTLLEQTGVIDVNQEGYVVEFSDGQRFKFKGDRYLEMHKLISGLNPKRIVNAMRGGNLHSEILDIVPDEYLNEVRQIVKIASNIYNDAVLKVEEKFEEAPKESRKDFAMWVQKNCMDVLPCMFKKYEGKPYTDLIYKDILNRIDKIDWGLDKLKDKVEEE